MNVRPAGSLSLRNVSKNFGAVQAVDSLSLDFPPGQITTLLGPSGCGKTTALRMIAGFIQPDSGEVLLDGRSQSGLPPFRRDTAMVFQDFALFPHMTVAHNVGYGLRHRRAGAAETRRRVAEMLGFLQLSDLADRMPHELSGGQQQRVALGRALAVRPRVLLMDEPLSNLDARLRVRLRSEFKAIQRELGVTTVFVTHDQEEALSLSDFMAVMNDGRVIQSGSPRELYTAPRSRFVAEVLGDANFLPATSQPGASAVEILGQKLEVRHSVAGTGGSSLLVRPGWFTLDGPPLPGGLQLNAVLHTAEYHGAHERYWFAVDGLPGPLQVDVPAGEAVVYGPGAEVTLRLAPGVAVLIGD